MNGLAVANKIKDLLEGIDGWTGNIFTYIPNVRDDKQYLEAMVDKDTKQVDVWWIRRNSIRTTKYGQGGRSLPNQYRLKTHVFSIRGFQSVYDAGKIEDATSEIDFQERCDEIEETLAKSMSLGITTHDAILTGVSIAIGYDSLSKALCHTATIDLTVEERICTTYEQ